MSLMDKVTEFARGPQGRRLTEQAKRLAQDPSNRRRLEQVRTRLSRRGGRGPT